MIKLIFISFYYVIQETMLESSKDYQSTRAVKIWKSWFFMHIAYVGTSKRRSY